MDEQFKKKIIEDISKSGFTSEMLASKIFLENKWFDASSGGYYDKDENKTREIDITAYKPLVINNAKKKINVFFHSICEVKKSKSPWIIFKDNSLKHYNTGDAWNNMIFKDNLPVASSTLTNVIGKYSLLNDKKWIGNSIHESFKKPDVNSQWYSAVLASIKASEHILEKESWVVEKKVTYNPEKTSYFVFVKPIVILDGQLFSAQLSNRAEIEIEEINSAVLKFEYKSKQYKRSSYLLDIVTLDKLSSYLEMVDKRQQNIFTHISKLCNAV